MRIYLFACLCLAPWLPLPGQYFYFQEVLPVLAAKHCIMQANAELHQSALAKQKKRFGEEIARLQVHSFLLTRGLCPTLSDQQFVFHILEKKNLEANPLRLVCAPLQHSAELVKTVASRDDEYVSVKDLSDKINRALVAAKKDNDFIYHDRVPEVKDLEHIGKAALVKAATITPPLSQKFTGEIRRRSTQVLTVRRVGHNSNNVSQFLLWRVSVVIC